MPLIKSTIEIIQRNAGVIHTVATKLVRKEVKKKSDSREAKKRQTKVDLHVQELLMQCMYPVVDGSGRSRLGRQR